MKNSRFFYFKRFFAYYTGTPEWIACYEFYCGDQGNGCEETITAQYHIYTGQKSDGLLCGATQIRDDIGNGFHYEALGINHAGETNSRSGTTLNGNDEMKRVFNLVWNKDISDFFITPLR